MAIMREEPIAKKELFDALGRVKNTYGKKINEAIQNGDTRKASLYSEAFFMLQEDLLTELGCPKRKI